MCDAHRTAKATSGVGTDKKVHESEGERIEIDVPAKPHCAPTVTLARIGRGSSGKASQWEVNESIDAARKRCGVIGGSNSEKRGYRTHLHTRHLTRPGPFGTHAGDSYPKQTT